MTEKSLILLVEDNPELNAINRRVLNLAGYRVQTAGTIAQARALLAKGAPEVILLDVSLPDGDGMDFCREVRHLTDAHILFLTARTGDEDKIRGLANGGDDYITKPYRLEEMLARVQAALRRRSMTMTPLQSLVKGLLTLELSAQRAWIAGQDLLLTPKEFALLLYFVQNEGRRISAQELFQAIWSHQGGFSAHTVQVHISNLRKKLQEHSGCAVSVEMEERKYYRLTLES